MAVFFAVYFIRNNAGTYEAYDNEGTLVYSGTSLVTNVLNQIEAAHATGDFAVLFGVGTFDMGTEWWTLNGCSDVLIEGMGYAATRVINSSDAASDTEPFSFTDCNRVTIRDLEVAAGGLVRTTSDALDFDGGNECLLERVKVSDSRGRGIVFDGKEAGSSASGNTIRDCIVTGTRGGTSQAGSGIQLLSGDRCHIEGNYVHNTTGPGIYLTKASSTAGQPNKKSTYNVVKGNVVDQAGTHGIGINSSDDNIIEGNVVINSGDDAASQDGIRISTADTISADRNVIEGNIARDDQGTKTQRYGINVGPASVAEANDNLVVGNVLKDNLTGNLNNVGTGTLVRSNVGAADN